MNLRQAVGSLLIVGVEGTALSAVETAWLRLIRPAGVILFRRNIEEAVQVHGLLQAVSGLCKGPAFRCVDLEGGLVDRLRDLVARMPSAAEVAATGKAKLFREHGRLIGDEIALLGFNTTFAPVLDLALPISSAVLRTRAAARHSQDVIRYASGFLAGLKKAGVLGSGKHFPGLGGGTLDSHQAMPEIDRGWQQLWEEDLLPYRKLRRRLPFVMVSHASYPRVKAPKEKNGPASISKYWIGEVLQKKISYNGLVLSDDMEMGGILTQRSIQEASIAAIEAGTHLLEVCKDPALIFGTYEALLSEAERSRAFRRKVERAAMHVERQKRRLLGDGQMTGVPAGVAIDSMRQRVTHFSAVVTEAAMKEQTHVASRTRKTLHG